jgi:hypothetical protein
VHRRTHDRRRDTRPPLPACTRTEFAYAATLGRMIIFLSGTVSVSPYSRKLPPEVPSQPNIASLYLRSLTLHQQLHGDLPRPLLRHPRMDATPHCFGMPRAQHSTCQPHPLDGCLIMAISSLLQLNAHSCFWPSVASASFPSLSLCAIAYIVGIHYMGSTIGAIMIIAASTNLLAFIATTVGILRPDPGLMGLTKR